jgi:hypothetical protein
MIRTTLTFIFILIATNAYPKALNDRKTKSKRIRKTPTETEEISPRKSTKDENRTKDIRFLVGAGLQSLYLPSLGIEGMVVRGPFQIGGELGFFQFSQAEFRGSTSFIGINGRWQLHQDQPFFVGASFGSRNISLTTSADMSYTDVTTGTSTTTSIAWTRKVSQTVFFPKAGWFWSNKTSAVIAAGGLIMPLGSKASITGNPPSADGISDEDYQTTANSKLQDVTKTTHAILPSLEFKYARFLN